VSTSRLLRQAIHELEAALDAAAREYGRDSPQAAFVSDALSFMQNWMRHYAALRDKP